MLSHNKNKCCQFCATEIPINASFCLLCDRTQIDRSLYYQRYIKLIFLRISAPVLTVLATIFTLLWAFDFFIETIVLVMWLFFSALFFPICYFFLIPLILGFWNFVLENFEGNTVLIASPHLVKRVAYLNKIVTRDWIVYLILATFICKGIVHLDNHTPSKNQFKKYLTEETNFRSKHITHEFDIPVCPIYVLKKGRHVQIYVGLNDGFVPLISKIYTYEFPETLVNNKSI